MKINLGNFYLLRVDCDCFIIEGIELDRLITMMKEFKTIEFYDINNNFLSKPYTPETRVMFQELYKIKGIELE